MKNLLILFVTLFILTSCDKDNDKTKKPIDQLPPATQIGANTAGCLVDGEAFLPKGNLQNNLVCNYIDGKDFNISIGEKVNDKIRSLNVISYNNNLIVGEIYQLKEYGASSKFGEFIIYNQDFSKIEYRTNSSIIGELKITYHNFDKAILSGTFWFDAINSEGKVVKVREGRFDMEY